MQLTPKAGWTISAHEPKPHLNVKWHPNETKHRKNSN